MKYSEQDMAALISEVEAQFAEHLAKAEAKVEEETLAKSEEEVVETAETSDVVAAEASEEMQKSEEEVEVNFDYDEEDIAEMDKLYASMTKAEAEAHLASIHKALGIETSTEEIEVKSEDKAVMAKSEDKAEAKSEENTEDELLKSELESVKKENEELKKSFEKLTAALTSYVKKGTSAPKQKAITKIEYIAKSEEEVIEDKKEEDFSKLSKNEISGRLAQKIREGKLEKSDREKINQYYLDNAKLETIKHLLV